MTNQIIHGDALSILRSMESASVNAIITDPPYGIDFNSNRSRLRPFGRIANDKSPFIWWLYDAFRVLKSAEEGGGVLITFTRWDVQQVFMEAMQLAGFSVRSEVIWNKLAHGAGDTKAQFSPMHENIIFATKGKFAFPGKRPEDVLSVKKVSADKLVHANEKPVALLEALIESLTRPGDIVLDPFIGSGSTLIAAEQTGRQYIGIEIDAEKCAVAGQRVVAAIQRNGQS